MLHVDEGALHAYLDGALDEYPADEAERIRAHLDACAECAERLEIERAARTDAHAILALASPDVELPSLEELRAYVKRTRPAPSKTSVRMYRFGWAASVMLAVGTGWMLRDGQLAVTSGDAFRASQEEAAAAVAAPAEAPQLDATVSADAVVAEEAVEARPREAVLTDDAVAPESAPLARAAAPSGEALQPQRELETAPAEVLELDEVVASAASQAQGAGAGVPAEAAPETLRDLASPSVATELVASAPQDPSAAESTDSALPGADGAAGNAFADLGSVVASGADPEVASPVDQDAAAKAEPEEERAERRRSDSPVAVTSALDQTAGARSGVSDDDVELETLVAGAVPGLRTVTVSNVGEGTVYLGSVITQRTEDGAEIRVYRLEVDVEPEVLGEVPDGENEVMRQIDEEWVVIRGARSTEELEGYILLLLPES